MAQYTPNFNLYEPDSTDDFADFRTEFNNNMNIIDQNLGGGGGSGGHTIYDKDGNALAQESGLQFTGAVNVSDDSVNGRTVVDILGGGGAVYGAFIDTTRIIASGNIPQGSSTYTATEDCALLFTILSDSNNSAKIEIDGVKAWEQYDQNGINSFANFLLVRSGQTVTFTQSYSSNGNYKAYGLLQGTNGIYAPVIYSDNERVIGVWRDNKPLYAKTLNPSVNVGSNTINHGIANLEKCVRIYGVCKYNNTSEQLPLPYVSTNTAYNIACGNVTSTTYLVDVGTGFSSIQECYVTLFYTKTTDVAGSGNWNTDGVPTHHYSTSEQVVGTWTNGKPCYEITLEGSGSYVSNTEHIISIPLNADNVRIMSGFVDIGTDWLPISLTLGLGTGSTNGIYCYPNKSNGLHLFSSAWTFTNYSIVIQYTKTTDT